MKPSDYQCVLSAPPQAWGRNLECLAFLGNVQSWHRNQSVPFSAGRVSLPLAPCRCFSPLPLLTILWGRHQTTFSLKREVVFFASPGAHVLSPRLRPQRTSGCSHFKEWVVVVLKKKSLYLLVALRWYFFRWQLRFPHALSRAIFALNSSADGQKTEAVWLVLSAGGGWGEGEELPTCFLNGRRT